jgi:hypothetical protein
MGFRVVMRTGTLRGMEREIPCIVGMPLDAPDSEPSIQSPPADFPDGQYVFTFDNGSIHFRRIDGKWEAQ